MSDNNSHAGTVSSFGREWSTYDQAPIAGLESTSARFLEYFSIFPWDALPRHSEGADVGCGSGRWALQVAPKVGTLHCIDASGEALEVARRNLSKQGNCQFHRASVGDIPIPAASLDFCYSLGVLHHVPDTFEGIKSCVKLLKPGAPFLVYLYYDLETRPWWYRSIWRTSDILRRSIARLPYWPKRLVCEGIAFTVYLPMAALSGLVEKMGGDPNRLPLSWYRDKPMYTLRTNAFDRFGTELEQRFSRAQIDAMMRAAGLGDIVFSEKEPFWCAVGRRLSPSSI
jgi:SAM-dependent methyltransferase